MCPPKIEKAARPVPVDAKQTAERVVLPSETKADNSLRIKQRGRAALTIPRDAAGLNIPR